MRVMADHIRALAFAIADGAIPSNEDRGYVLRRILRRASRYARNLNLHEPALYKLVPTLAGQMGSIFPELREKQPLIERVVKAEEESFNQTLDPRHRIVQQHRQARRGKRIARSYRRGNLHTLRHVRLPADLTALMAKEHGMEADMAGLNG